MSSPGNVRRALAERFAAPEYAYLEEVRNSTGHRDVVRTADAMAMSLYPSRGLHLHGIEIKCSRSDWTNELKNPDKAEEIAKFCDFWWLAISDMKVIKDANEVPAGWGILAIVDEKLKVVRQAKLIEKPADLDRTFLAAILRKASNKSNAYIHSDDIAVRLEAKYKEGIAVGVRSEKYRLDETRNELGRIKEVVADFERASGISLPTYSYQGSHMIGKAVKVLLQANPADLAEQLKHLATNAREIATKAQRAYEELPHTTRKAELVTE